MKSIFLTPLLATLLLSCSIQSFAQLQSGMAKVDNVDFSYNGRQIIITYDLTPNKADQVFFIWCEVYSGIDKKIETKSFSGDVWDNIKPGKGKRIIWDFKSDGVLPSDEIYIKVSAAEKTNPDLAGALMASTVFPGWGATRVTHQKGPLVMGYLGYACLAGAGAMALNSKMLYDDYKSAPIASKYDQAVAMRTGALALVGSAAVVWTVNYFVTASKIKNHTKKQPDYFQLQQENRLISSTSQIKLVDTKSKPEILANSNAANLNIYLESDVNTNIPVFKGKPNPNRFALIFGNEDYASKQTDTKSEINVTFARTDAFYFREYCELTLGIPKDNIVIELDATAGTMKRKINQMIKLMNSVGPGNAELVFYYAGHGFPDSEKEAYLIPTDVTGDAVTEGIKLSDLYRDLTAAKPLRVTVFLDACFSGGGRNAGLLATRGVKLKPKTVAVTNNLIVFSATSQDQKANPHNAGNHGLFTYFLLKKLQESEGNATYYELSDYLKRKVQGQSIRNNSDEQIPEVNVSPDLMDVWEDFKLK